MTNMWMVRAGDDAFLYDEIKNRNIAIIGWGIKDVRGKNKDEIKNLLEEKYPNKDKGTIGKWASMIFDFASSIEKGDYVVSSSHKSNKKFLLGKFTSDYSFSEELIEEGIDPDCIYDSIRDVKWLCEFPCAAVSEKNRRVIRKPPTLFEIKDKTKDEILNYYNFSMQ